MKVTLINYTQDAAELLIFTKDTRTQMAPTSIAAIKEWPDERKAEALAYIANTIPSSWEFADFTFLIEGVSRAFTHQLVRTRTGSYAQQAMRILPMQMYEYVHTKGDLANQRAMDTIAKINSQIQAGYTELLDMGHAVEDARGVLPTNVSTNIVAKFNLRSLADLAKSRCGGRSQSEYQQVAWGMMDAVIAVYPWAEQFLFKHGRDHFKEIEEFAAEVFSDDKPTRDRLLKIVDQLRKA